MAEIYYARLDEFWKKEEKYQFLQEKGNVSNIEWKLLVPDEKHNWLTEGLQADFETFLPMGTKEAKAGSDEAIFLNYSNGVKTNRDNWAYNFNKDELSKNISRMIEVYNEQVFKWSRLSTKPKVDDFVLNDDTKISWSEGLKNYLKRGVMIEYAENRLRYSIYRPFDREYLYFDKHITERRYQFHHIFPNTESEADNQIINVPGIGNRKQFSCFISNYISSVDFAFEKTQCFPFYTYAEDGSNRSENITDWALSQFRSHYHDDSISKWDIFHYIYGLLHSPQYREKYAANLKRELPRIPFAPDFRAFADAGRKLADMHVNYENQPEFPLKKIENPDEKLDWRVEKMRLSKDKTTIIYNHFLTLSGIPKEAFEYRLGNRSALDWIIDQYQVKTDKRSGIVNDPNRADDPQYIVRLIGKVITVSLETVRIVKGFNGNETDVASDEACACH